MAPSSVNSVSEFSFRTRQRHWDALKKNPNKTIDVAIIGGGIVGAGLLRELAVRGASNVFLFEKNDFASGTSGASSKLIHAGIRYLEQVWVHLKHGRIGDAFSNLRFVVQASRERKILGRMAPGLVHPKPIYFALSTADRRSSFSVWLGVWLYYLIQVAQGQVFSAPKAFFSKASLRKNFPQINASAVKASFRFWDSETDDARLVIENLQSANAHGGAALNYVELLDYERTESGVRLTLKNKETGETAVVDAKTLVNASGAFVDDVRARGKGRRPAEQLVDRVAGSHIDVYPSITDHSFYVSASDNRLVFLLRRDEDGLVYTRIGTTERPLPVNIGSDNPTPTQKELDYLTGLVRDYFPNAALNIVKADSGIRPLRSQHGLEAFQKSREHDIIQEGNVFHVVGVKLTDYRRVAGELAGKLGFSKNADLSLSPLRPDSLTRLYAETTIDEFVQRTMILHWEDYVFRRRGLKPVFDAEKNPASYRSEFDSLGDLLGWNSETRSLEIENVNRKRGILRPGERKAQDPR